MINTNDVFHTLMIWLFKLIDVTDLFNLLRQLTCGGQNQRLAFLHAVVHLQNANLRASVSGKPIPSEAHGDGQHLNLYATSTSACKRTSRCQQRSTRLKETTAVNAVPAFSDIYMISGLGNKTDLLVNDPSARDAYRCTSRSFARS